MMFCATIWESNMSIVVISATPQMISANAIGMPSAMAPSNEKVKTAMVMCSAPPISLTATRSDSLAWPETTR